MQMISLKVKWIRWAALATMISLGVIGGGATANAQAGTLSPWTAAGATGTVDEANQDNIFFVSGRAGIKSSTPTGTRVTLRYNVTATDGLFFGEGLSLGIRYRDIGVSERVIAKLIRKNLDTGAEATLLNFDSDTKPQSFGPQLQRASDCSSGVDFSNNTYHVEVELRKIDGTGDPHVEGPRLSGNVC